MSLEAYEGMIQSSLAKDFSEYVVPVDVTLGVIWLVQKKLSLEVKSQFQVSASLRVIALF